MNVKIVFFQWFVFCLSIVATIQIKVNLSVYYEGLCAESKRFITNQLSPTYHTLSHLLDIEFVPFGNSNWTHNSYTKEVVFECQHGFKECFANRIQSCMSAQGGSDTKLILTFIDCMFRSNEWRKPDITARNCSHQLGIDWSPLYDCSIGPYSVALQLQMSNKTSSLRPQHNWMPWITIDGKHSDQMQFMAETDLQKLVCDSYTQQKPIECRLKALSDAKYESLPISRYVNREGVIEP